MKSGSRRAVLCAMLVSLAGCVSVGPATPKLSAEVGDRIAEMKGLHELAMSRFFDSERRRIEDFLEKRWIPLFLQNFLGTSGIVRDINQVTQFTEQKRGELEEALKLYLTDESEAPRATEGVVGTLDRARAGEPTVIRDILDDFVEDKELDAAVRHVSALLGTDDPGRMIMEWAEAAHEQIDAQRRELLEPLNQAEREAMAELATAYGELLAAQGLITGRLEAAAKLTAEQDRLLEVFGVDETFKEVKGRLAKVSAGVGRALGGVDAGLASEDLSASEAAGLLGRLLAENLAPEDGDASGNGETETE